MNRPRVPEDHRTLWSYDGIPLAAFLYEPVEMCGLVDGKPVFAMRAQAKVPKELGVIVVAVGEHRQTSVAVLRVFQVYKRLNTTFRCFIRRLICMKPDVSWSKEPLVSG